MYETPSFQISAPAFPPIAVEGNVEDKVDEAPSPPLPALGFFASGTEPTTILSVIFAPTYPTPGSSIRNVVPAAQPLAGTPCFASRV